MRIFQLIFLIALLIVELVGTIGAASVVVDYGKKGIMGGDDIIILVMLFLCIVVTAVALLLWRKKKKFVILPMLGADLGLFFATGLVWELWRGEMSISDVIGIFVAVVMLFSIIVAVYSAICEAKNRKMRNQLIAENEWRFRKFNAEWYFDDAEEEYRELHPIPEDENSYEDYIEKNSDAIYVYASGFFAYLFAWLVKKKAVVNDMFDGEYEILDDIKYEKVNPAEILYNNLDGKVIRDDITDEMLDFLDIYYEDMSYRTVSYARDYDSVVANDNFRYCIDFSWETYSRLEQVINERYEYYLAQKGDKLYVSELWINKEKVH